MVNPINDSNPYKILDTESRLQRNQSVTPESHSDESNQVNLSNFSKQLNKLKEVILSAPEIDSNRVELLKEELASGRYQMNSKQIASMMFQDIEMA
ncbi:flagellar biosynthesis anti-sigma factor FlgM [Legionella jamestowniensis]|nr:flagellar biosynthesis anti-sigma factor FlgM [Legionella jamestowniensis]